jgi:hypothetical protein
MTDFRALCVELTEALRREHDWYIEDHGFTNPDVDELVVRVETALAKPDGPAVSDDREPASVTEQLKHQLLNAAKADLIRQVMDQALRDTAPYHWRETVKGEQLVRGKDLLVWAEYTASQMETSAES